VKPSGEEKVPMRAAAARFLATIGAAVALLTACTGGGAPSPASPATSPAAAPPTARAGAPAPTAGEAPSAPPGAAVAPLNPPVAVQIGVLNILGEAGIYIAAERGYFAEEGLIPELVSFDNTTRIVPALATGQIDVTGGGFSPNLVNAVQRGINLKLISSIQSSQPGRSTGGMLVRKPLVDSGQVRDWSDLRGLRVAIPGLSGLGGYIVERALDLGGLSLSDVELIELPFPDMIPAFGNGNIDAAHSAEPLTTLAVDRGVAALWHGTADYAPGVASSLITYGPSLLDQQQEVGRRFMVAFMRGSRAYKTAVERGERGGEIVQILTKHTSVKDPAMYERMGSGFVDPDLAIDMADIAAQAAYYVRQGLLPPTVEVAGLEDSSYRRAAVARLGPYRP
jgi:NitT/TauT family transport system substrate-binding protein